MTIDQLIAHCERQKKFYEAKASVAFEEQDEKSMVNLTLYDGKGLVYDEIIDKLKLLKEFGQ